MSMQTGDFRTFADALRMVIGQAESDIPANRFAEQISVLRHVPDGAAKRFQGPMLNGVAVNQHGSFPRLPEPGNQSGKRRFPAAGGPDHSKRGSSRDFQVDVGKNRVRTAAVRFAGARGSIGGGKGGWVGKNEVAELEFADAGGGFWKGRAAVVGIGFGREDGIQAGPPGGGALG